MMTNEKPARRTRVQWKKLIEGKVDSSLTTEEYCKENQITVSSFYAWRSRLKEGQPNKPSANTTDNWLPIHPPTSKPTEANWDIELDLPGGVTLRMKSA